MSEFWEDAIAFNTSLSEYALTHTGLDWAIAKMVYEARRKVINGKPFWVWLGFSTENEYFAAPVDSDGNGGLSMSPSKVSKYDRVYKKYVVDLGLDPTGDHLRGTTFTKLDVIRTIVNEDNGDEWLDKARALTCSDLIAEVREFKGVPDRPRSVYSLKIGDDIVASRELIDYGGQVWDKFVTSIKCCPVCGSKEGCDRAHYPTTRGAGGDEIKYMVIPLCRFCHTEQHNIGVDEFFRKYKKKIFGWLYNTLFLILAEK